MNDMASTDLQKQAESTENSETAPQQEFQFSGELALLSERGSLAAENISLLVSEILSRHIQSSRRGLSFCTTSRGSGCSYLAANVAVGMAMAGVQTLVVDANLRDPQLGKYIIAEEEGPGLLQCIEQSGTTLQDAVKADVLPNLSVLYAGGRSADAGLFASNEARSVFSEALRSYDCTIIDTAPSNQSADALRVANMVRYALVIARKNHTYVNDMKKLIADIRQNRGEVLGTYLNEL